MRLVVFGADKPATRAVVDDLFTFGSVQSLLILTRTGLARYAWDRAGDLAKDRHHFWLDRLKNVGDAMQVAVQQLVAVGKPDVALCISPRQNDAKVVAMLREAGCKVCYGRLDAGKNVTWQVA